MRGNSHRRTSSARGASRHRGGEHSSICPHVPEEYPSGDGDWDRTYGVSSETMWERGPNPLGSFPNGFATTLPLPDVTEHPIRMWKVPSGAVASPARESGPPSSWQPSPNREPLFLLRCRSGGWLIGNVARLHLKANRFASKQLHIEHADNFFHAGPQIRIAFHIHLKRTRLISDECGL